MPAVHSLGFRRFRKPSHSRKPWCLAFPADEASKNILVWSKGLFITADTSTKKLLQEQTTVTQNIITYDYSTCPARRLPPSSGFGCRRSPSFVRPHVLNCGRPSSWPHWPGVNMVTGSIARTCCYAVHLIQRQRRLSNTKLLLRVRLKSEDILQKTLAASSLFLGPIIVICSPKELYTRETSANMSSSNIVHGRMRGKVYPCAYNIL